MPPLLALLLACRPDPEPESPFTLPLADLGAPLAAGVGYDFASPQDAFFAARHVAPGVEERWSLPPSNMPLLLWENLLQGENVADPGSCPYVQAEGARRVWVSGCRSEDGYEWEGSVSVEETEDADGDWERWRFDLDVTSEVEGRSFDRVRMQGGFDYMSGDGEVSRWVQANWAVEAEGYWANNFEEELEAAWSALALTGVYQAQETESGALQFVLQATVDLGEAGGFNATADSLTSGAATGCPVEPDGGLTLVGAQTAVLTFEGPDRCDGCAQLTIDGERQANACRGL
ncbi:hypothetical protein L6R49_11245 [Myxococcota bacterium]|nr:hypothetical protein [Myxococcota bacterium]